MKFSDFLVYSPLISINRWILSYWSRMQPRGVHLNIRAGPTFAGLVWAVPPHYNYLSGRLVCGKTICFLGHQIHLRLNDVFLFHSFIGPTV